MFGSMKQPDLVGDRNADRPTVLTMPMVLPAVEAAKILNDFLASYQGDAGQLMFGYWDYGGEIIVTAPSSSEDE